MTILYRKDATMTKQLRMRIMIILILLLSTTYLAIIAAINIGLNKGNRDLANDSLRFLIQEESRPDDLPEPLTDKGSAKDDSNMKPPTKPIELSSSHHIIVKYDKGGQLQSIDNNLSDSYTDNDIEAFCQEILDNEKEVGTIDQLRFMKRENKDSIIIAFIDHSSAVESGKTLQIISIVGSILAIGIFVLISYFLSGWLVKPVEEAFDKQKQFISDASHELKTPITVILSNSELLEDQIGNNKQLSYIKEECDRMKYLVTSLLTLTRLEHTPYKGIEKNDFCISDTVLERLLPMESVAFEKGITMNYDDVTPNLHFYGVKEQIGQVTAILLDNAITHTDKGGKINISLWNTPHHLHLTVANTGKEIPVDVREKLFERFYRADESRHRASGHFGLGLSIAKTIVTNHKGKIWVDCENGITTFSVNLRTQTTKENPCQ